MVPFNDENARQRLRPLFRQKPLSGAACPYVAHDYRPFIVVAKRSGYVFACSAWFGLSFVHPHPEFRIRIRPPASKRGVFLCPAPPKVYLRSRPNKSAIFLVRTPSARGNL